jgi:protoporphyrinogen oxidase
VFINKDWDYGHNQNEQPDHSFLALNYRMSELQGAVAVAQLSKLAAVVQRRVASAVLTELGLEHEMEWVETRTGFYTQGQLYSMSNTFEFLRFPPLRLLDKLRLGLTIFYTSRLKNWRALEQIPVADWLTRWSGQHTFEHIWLPLLRAKLGEQYQHTSAASIWATIARMYAARRTGLKKEMFGYVPGGYARVLAGFAELLASEQVQIHLQHVAKKVSPHNGQGTNTDGGMHVEFTNGRHEHFDQVILTTSASVAARVCPALSSAEKTTLQAMPYQGIICASVVLKRPLADFYVTNITGSGMPFTAVIEMSALVDRQHFGGLSLVYLPKYLAPNDPTFEASDEEIETTFTRALLRMYPHIQASDIVCFRVSRVREVFPLPTLHYSDRLCPMTTSVPGLHIVNSAHILNGTLNANETVQLANRAVHELLSQSVSAPSLGCTDQTVTAVPVTVDHTYANTQANS